MSLAVDLTQPRDLLRRQDPAAAWRVLEPLLQAHPDHVEMLLLAGRIHLALEQSARACEYFGRAVKLSPSLHTAQFLHGFALYLENDFAPALLSLQAAQRLKPNDGQTLLYLALTYEGLADGEAAMRLYPAAVRHNPSSEAPLAYARYLFSLGRYADAQLQLDESLRRDPQLREAHSEQARLHLEQGRVAQAVTSAELALRLPGLAQSIRPLHFLLARAYQKLGNLEEARKHRATFEAIPARLVR